MKKKLLFWALAIGAAMLVSACDEEGPVSSELVTPPTSSAVVPLSSSAVNNGGVAQSPYGILPTVKNMDVALGLYGTWKATYYKTYLEEAALYPVLAQDWTLVFGNYVAAGMIPARIVWDTQNDAYCVIDESNDSYKKRGCTVSEAIGYGMLITLFAGDMQAFNSLWYYNRGYREYQGSNLMPWKVGTFSYESLVATANSSSATDADLDIATALILAYYSTGDIAYLNDALLIVNAIWDNEIEVLNSNGITDTFLLITWENLC